ncbi:hypothetical protein ABZ663_29565 [Streptomyces albidoflavus]|uniref:hypothetical protein n=1 Tax=Streptomyces albidoflavus TaxID=1886 RepID=UPI0033F76104
MSQEIPAPDQDATVIDLADYLGVPSGPAPVVSFVKDEPVEEEPTVLVVQDQDEPPVKSQPQPVLPEVFTDPEARRHQLAVVRHSLVRHGVRSPVYAGRALGVVGLGARAAVRDSWSYVTAGEYGELIRQVRESGAGAEHIADLRAERAQKAGARRRESATVWSATGVATYAASVLALGQAWSLALVFPALLPVMATLYALGRREIRGRLAEGETFALTDLPADSQAEERPLLGADTINGAFHDAGLLKGDQQVSLVGSVRAVQMDAAEARIRLPRTLTAEKVLGEKAKLASALGVHVTWLDIAETAEPGVLSLWVAASDPLATSALSPLLEDPESVVIDVWRKGIPFGRNRRGEVVHMPFRHVNGLIGGTTRSGKGMALRSIIPGLGLDPRVRIRLVVGAKPGEHRAYAPVTSTFFGKRPVRLLDLLDAMIEEADRREAVLEDEGRAKFNEKDLERFPLEVLIVDEFPQYTMSKERIPDPTDEEGRRTLKVGEEIEHRLSKLAAYCTALNMDIVLLAQDPDAATVPRGFRNNTGSRTAFRTNSATQTNAILKDGSTGAGLRAHDIKVSQPGVAIVDLDGAEGELIRTFNVPDDRDEDEADPIAPVIAEGVARRSAVGCLAGQYEDRIEQSLLAWTGQTSAAGGPTGSGRPGSPEDAETGPVGILADMLAVFAAVGQPERMRTSNLLQGLAARDSATWSPEALGVDSADSEDPADLAAYVRTGGTELRRQINEALDGTGRSLAPKGWSAGGRANGYYLAEIRAAAGIDPV